MIAQLISFGVVVCTAFSSGPNEWTTAAHCLVNPVTINGHTAELLDAVGDVAILKAPTPGGYFSRGLAPVVGDTVRTRGYLYNMGDTILQTEHYIVATDANYIGMQPIWEDVIITSDSVGETHSGSPVFNEDGHIIALHVGWLQPTTQHTFGIALPLIPRD